ncbi:response regulator [Photobacterium gaetbulicola]|nr:response regulator [Photobacterium gaetbulicola]
MTKTTVMVLEDDIRASYTLESTINQHPQFNVVAVSESYADALLQFNAFNPDLVFVDITLPDGSGLALIRALRAKNVSCSFIMTTAEREAATVEQAVQLGVMDYLVKPIRMSRVNQALEDYLKYRRTLTTAATVDQNDIDQLFRKSPVAPVRSTPKGIDATTLANLKQILLEEQLQDFSADDIGKKMNVSRITARRYLEFLETEGMIKLVLNYKTGGRPQRLYQLLH